MHFLVIYYYYMYSFIYFFLTETRWASVRPSESRQKKESTVRRWFRSGYGIDRNLRRGTLSVSPQHGPSRAGSRGLMGLSTYSAYVEIKNGRVGLRCHSFVSQLHTQPSAHVSFGWNSRKVNSRPSYLSRVTKKKSNPWNTFFLSLSLSLFYGKPIEKIRRLIIIIIDWNNFICFFPSSLFVGPPYFPLGHMQIPYRHFFLFVGTSYLFQPSSILRSDIVPFFDPSSIPLFLLWQVSFLFF